MNTVEFRNLAEQVLKNKQDILKHFEMGQVLADFGIRIIGQVDTADELPESGGEYGDAYAVGTESPFTYYIWTRANNVSPTDYWFDFGKLQMVGPVGPKGDPGRKGDTGASTRWYVNPDAQPTPADGDMAIDSAGNVYMASAGLWARYFNIRGPQGIQGIPGKQGIQGEPGDPGPKGDTGDVGGFINIAGIVNTEYDLPDPELIGNLTVAYLVGTTTPYDLYIQVGSTSATAEWFNAGPLNVATYVTVNGQFQNVWDADTKLDKKTANAGQFQLYGLKGPEQHMFSTSYGPNQEAIPIYGNNGIANEYVLRTDTPTEDRHCVNKKYVDNNTVAKNPGNGSYDLVYAVDPNGNTAMIPATWSTLTGGIPRFHGNGRLTIGLTPEQPQDAASKQYVDNQTILGNIRMTGDVFDPSINTYNYAIATVIYGKTWKQMAQSGINFEGLGHLTMDDLESSIYIKDNTGTNRIINRLEGEFEIVQTVHPDDIIDRTITYTLRQ